MAFKEFFNFGNKNENNNTNESESKNLRTEIKEMLGQKGRVLTFALMSLLMASAVSSQSKTENNDSLKGGPVPELLDDSLEQQEGEIKTWKTVKVGDYGEKNTPDFIKNLLTNVSNNGIDVGIFRAMKLAEKEKSVDVTVVSPKDLGLSKGATAKDLEDALKKHNLDYIEPEAFLQLFLENDINDINGKEGSIVAGMNGIKYETKELDVQRFREYIPGTRKDNDAMDFGKYKIVKDVELKKTGDANHLFAVRIAGGKLPELSTVDAPDKLDLINLDQLMAFQKK